MEIFSNDALNDKHVLITGATGGIGYETAKLAASMGARVSITGRNESKLMKLKDELENITDEEKIYAHIADINEKADREELVEACEKQQGFITSLVNSAGKGGGDVVENLDEDFITNMMNINYTSTVLLTQLVYKKMLEKEQGDIINLASMSGLRGVYGNASYCASKFALVGFTESLALEAAPHHIRVNAVAPGFVNTEMAEGIIGEKAERNGVSYQEQLQTTKDNLPSGRITEPEEIAHVIAFLLTGASENLLGTSIKITGGTK